MEQELHYPALLWATDLRGSLEPTGLALQHLDLSFQLSLEHLDWGGHGKVDHGGPRNWRLFQKN
jgi:hypothetical protein